MCVFCVRHKNRKTSLSVRKMLGAINMVCLIDERGLFFFFFPNAHSPAAARFTAVKEHPVQQCGLLVDTDKLDMDNCVYTRQYVLVDAVLAFVLLYLDLKRLGR